MVIFYTEERTKVYREMSKGKILFKKRRYRAFMKFLRLYAQIWVISEIIIPILALSIGHSSSFFYFCHWETAALSRTISPIISVGVLCVTMETDIR